MALSFRGLLVLLILLCHECWHVSMSFAGIFGTQVVLVLLLASIPTDSIATDPDKSQTNNPQKFKPKTSLLKSRVKAPTKRPRQTRQTRGLDSLKHTSDAGKRNSEDPEAERGRRVQLHRALSKLGYCSRSMARGLIGEGRVALNGRVAVEPMVWVDIAKDVIAVDGRTRMPKHQQTGRVDRRVWTTHLQSSNESSTALPVCTVWKLHKPRGYVTARRDERGRKTVYDLIPDWLRPAATAAATADGNFWIFPIGRLDKDSEGLLLFTTDGKLGDRLLERLGVIACTHS